MAVCGIQSVDLTRDAIKILGVYFSYNINLMNQKNYCQAITNIHGILKLWRMRNLSIKDKIVVFKTLAISKLVYLALLTVIPDHITDEVTKIQKSFIWNDSSPKIKHETLRMEFKAQGLKNVDIRFKFVSLQCSWVKKLYDDCFHEWKIIPLHLLNKCFGPSFKFHSNLHFESKLLKQFPSFYKQILMNWKKYFIASPITPSRVLSQFIWYNSYIKIDSKAVYLKSFSTKNINFVTQLFHTDGSVKNWNILKTEYALQNKDQFCWLQLINAIPEMWKKCIEQTSENTSFLVDKNDHLLRGSRIIILEKLNSKKLYSLLISAIEHQPTSQKYFDNLFPNIELSWKEIYLTARKATANSYLRCFNYQIINNVLYLNKKLFQFGKTQSPLCSFCHTEAETTLHIFHKCSATKILWNRLLLFFETDLDCPDLTPQAALFGFVNESNNNLNILQNHILLIFKLYVYQSRERGVLNLNSLIKNVTKVKKLEGKIASVCEKKTIQFNNKWKSTDLKITV